MVRVEMARWGQTLEDLRRVSVAAMHRRSRERFQALYLIASGRFNTTTGAAHIRRQDETVLGWVHRYHAHGPDALIYRRTGGRAPLLTGPGVWQRFVTNWAIGFTIPSHCLCERVCSLLSDRYRDSATANLFALRPNPRSQLALSEGVSDGSADLPPRGETRGPDPRLPTDSLVGKSRHWIRNPCQAESKSPVIQMNWR
jgi:hypothetical protein